MAHQANDEDMDVDAPENVDEEEIKLLEAEIRNLEAAVKERRENGPLEYRALVEQQLRNLRPQNFSSASNEVDDYDKEMADLKTRLSAAILVLPALNQRMIKSKAELSKRFLRSKKGKALHGAFEKELVQPAEIFRTLTNSTGAPASIRFGSFFGWCRA